MGLQHPREQPSDRTDAGDTSGSIRQTVLYSGRVQGVGFRHTTATLAKRFPVEGYVQNLPDGTVELVVEGIADEVDLFLSSLAARMQAYVTGSSRRQTVATGEFGRFFIKRVRLA